MSANDLYGYCYDCDRFLLVQRAPVRHRRHFFCTVLTGGLWCLVWGACCYLRQPWRCSRCHGTTVFDAMPDTGTSRGIPSTTSPATVAVWWFFVVLIGAFTVFLSLLLLVSAMHAGAVLTPEPFWSVATPTP